MAEKKPVAELNYEQAFEELQEIVAALEEGAHTLDESLALFERGQALAQHCGQLLEQADFTEAAQRKAKGYSGGMMRQLNLLMALISDPDIVYLDEPTVGMDARARRRTWEDIASLKEQGKTVILTTHYIEEAQSLSNRVGIIDYGELIALGTPQELMEHHNATDLEAVFLKITGRRIAEGS